MTDFTMPGRGIEPGRILAVLARHERSGRREMKSTLSRMRSTSMKVIVRPYVWGFRKRDCNPFQGGYRNLQSPPAR